MENVRFNISPCLQSEVSDFVAKLDPEEFVPNGIVRATERSHYDRYSFFADDSRVALVYDTSASILSITGRQDHASKLLEIFGAEGKTIKRSSVPAQGTPTQPPERVAPRPYYEGTSISTNVDNGGTRARLFVSPDSLKRRAEYKPMSGGAIVSAKGGVSTTDVIYPPQKVERKRDSGNIIAAATDDFSDSDVIYPPQIARKRNTDDYVRPYVSTDTQNSGRTYAERETPSFEIASEPVRGHGKQAYSQQPQDYKTFSQPSSAVKQVGLTISVGRPSGALPRKAVISFGTDDDGKSNKETELKISRRLQPVAVAQSDTPSQEQVPAQAAPRKRGRPPKQKPQAEPAAVQATPRKRGRPPKINKTDSTADLYTAGGTSEYKNGYAIKNYRFSSLEGAIARLRANGKTVTADATEFAGKPNEIKNFSVTDREGQKVIIRYATNRMTLQLQGKRTDLFGDVLAQVDSFSEDNMQKGVNAADNVSHYDGRMKDALVKLKRRLPTAYDYLSEQSRIDFSYTLRDFGQTGLQLSDYSVLLVPAFRGLERFVFDLQSAEGIKVKMIGQAFDKNEHGRYILKSGYTRRIDSVIYAEVLVSLYTEYFSQRNFFAHSDNTDGNASRSIADRISAFRIFGHLLDVVEYNAKKLKEIKFSINK